jgi:hypothetical protein
MVLTMGRIRNGIQVSATVNSGRMLSATVEAALMGVIIIIKGNTKLP